MKPQLKIGDIELEYLDTGFWIVPDRLAKELARANHHKLPRPGYELLVEFDGKVAWLQRTPNSVRIGSPKRGWSWAVYAVKEIQHAK